MAKEIEMRDLLGQELAELAGADVERWVKPAPRAAEPRARPAWARVSPKVDRLRPGAYALGLIKQRAARKAATRIAELLGATSR